MITILFYIYNFVVLLVYLLFRGDVEIVFNGIKKNASVFEITAKSFLTMCNEFCRVNSHTNVSHIKLLSSEFHAFC